MKSKKKKDSDFRSVGNEPLDKKENTLTRQKSSKGKASHSKILVEKIIQRTTIAQHRSIPELIAEMKAATINRGGEKRIVIGDTDDRKPVLKTIYPYNVICLLQVTTPNGQFQATGFLISQRCVITAGHCVFAEGNWATNISVIPGAIAGTQPYGSSVSERFRSVEGWTVNEDSNLDYGAIILPDNAIYQQVNATLGYKLYESEKEIEIAGYPRDKLGEPYTCTGTVQDTSPYRLYYDADTSNGDSGSPVMTSIKNARYALGLHTDGNKLNYGIRLNQTMMDRWAEWRLL